MIPRTILTPIDGEDKDNLIIEAAKLLRDYCQQHNVPLKYHGADISIDKKLHGGGLGEVHLTQQQH